MPSRTGPLHPSAASSRPLVKQSPTAKKPPTVSGVAGSFASLFNSAGGVSYHLRAALHGKTRWQPFRIALRAWLSEWQPSERHLVLVGPSAGYSLPWAWLTRFDCLTILEPDPLARWLLRRRLTSQATTQRLDCSFVKEDHLLGEPSRLVELVAGRDAAILFCNVLGQLGHLLGPDASDANLQAIKLAVQAALAGRSFASYHDRVSGRGVPTRAASGHHSDRRLTDTELGALYAESASPVTLFDHGSDGIFDASLPHSYFAWQLTPGYFHLIEAVRQTRD